ncbi:MAG: hypothetical protein V1899_10830 [Planctomycetota bacterium]
MRNNFFLLVVTFVSALALTNTSECVRASETETDVAPMPATKATVAERVVVEARRILVNVKTTAYSHKIKVDEQTGHYELDCSALAALILRAVAPEALKAIAISEKKSRPHALQFYQAFADAPTDNDDGGGHWRQIQRLLDARTGDFIAWRKLEIKAGESTGHVMVIDETPTCEPDGRIRIVVIDSTSRPHANDSRSGGGVGRGTLWFKTDAEGRPVGYYSRPSSDHLNVVPLAIGRIVEQK